MRQSMRIWTLSLTFQFPNITESCFFFICKTRTPEQVRAKFPLSSIYAHKYQSTPLPPPPPALDSTQTRIRCFCSHPVVTFIECIQSGEPKAPRVFPPANCWNISIRWVLFSPPYKKQNRGQRLREMVFLIYQRAKKREVGRVKE